MNTLVWLSLILNAMTLLYIIKHETFKEKQHDELIKLVEQRLKQNESKSKEQIAQINGLLIEHELKINVYGELLNVVDVGYCDDCSN